MNEPKKGEVNVTPDAAAAVARALRQVDELFHRVSRAIPANQQVLTFLPNTLARDAINILAERYFSQAPVALGNKVLGVFSFRSFAQKASSPSLADLQKQKHAPGDLTVEECMEKLNFADLTNELRDHFDALERDNCVLVGTSGNLLGILTAMDVLRYLYKLASPFVALSEIELALRTLIRGAVSEDEISKLASAVLKGQFGDAAKVPKSLEQMTFDNYRLLVASGTTWATFQAVFGGSRERVNAKLVEVGELRNDLFHFKRTLTDEDAQVILRTRDWLLTRMEQFDHRRGAGHE